jgi:hypothetical protein
MYFRVFLTFCEQKRTNETTTLYHSFVQLWDYTLSLIELLSPGCIPLKLGCIFTPGVQMEYYLVSHFSTIKWVLGESIHEVIMLFDYFNHKIGFFLVYLRYVDFLHESLIMISREMFFISVNGSS